ncbi:hypothetical protein GJ700_01955 [Duganella sp. FT92W]|uniref:Phenol degradation protein meta n=2 Tax=Pseudoduganella rivuli TaxID=2666085 RepID=A0A7X2LS67_9BURK|nr:hypothetical protein [Pseudoduganella rivuli]
MLALTCAALTAQAAEGGGSTYAAGADNFLLGAVPPPGLYVLQFANFYEADRLNDSRGEAVPIPGFSLHANVTATRIVWSSPYPVWGGNLVAHAVLPVVNLTLDAGGASQSKTGLGDVTFGPAVAHHYSPNLHSVVGFDLVAPTGRYNKTDMLNVGRNYWSLQPLFTMAYTDAQGFNGDFKATLNLNRTNSATRYRSGNEFILDYAAGYGFGPGWVAGVSGYYMRQLSDDTLNGVKLPDRKGRGASIGPSLMYNNGKGWILTAKLQRELGERNRAQGHALALRTTVPF